MLYLEFVVLLSHLRFSFGDTLAFCMHELYLATLLILSTQYVQTDIDSHKHPVDAVNEAAASLIKTSDPQKARNVQAKLDELNSRFGKIAGSTHNLGEYLTKLLEKINKLQIDIDNFEDWLLPMIQRLEAKELSRMDLLELGSKLMVNISILYYNSFKILEILNLMDLLNTVGG